MRKQKSDEKSQIRKREQELKRLQVQKKVDDMDKEINQLSSHRSSKTVKRKRVPKKQLVEISDSSETDETESESEGESETEEEEIIPKRAKKKH